MKQPIVLESNQNHATITDSGICPTLPASMGMGGGYVPMIVMSVDTYNQAVSLEVTEPLRAGEGGDERAKVLIVKDEAEDIGREKIFRMARR